MMPLLDFQPVTSKRLDVFKEIVNSNKEYNFKTMTEKFD